VLWPGDVERWNKAFLLSLDWNLPDLSGIDVLRRIRQRSRMPVIFCTAREGQDDVVAGLQAGADDYLRKPIRRMEFLARIEAVTRRARRIDEKADAFQIECFHVDCTNRAITRDGRQLDLTSKDFDLAVLFLANLGRLLSRSYISQTVWGTSCPVTSRTIDTHISRI